jgi:PAS domain-containing protein
MTILNNIGDPVFLKDEKLLIVNDAFCEMIGRSKADSIGRHLPRLFHLKSKRAF